MGRLKSILRNIGYLFKVFFFFIILSQGVWAANVYWPETWTLYFHVRSPRSRLGVHISISVMGLSFNGCWILYTARAITWVCSRWLGFWPKNTACTVYSAWSQVYGVLNVDNGFLSRRKGFFEMWFSVQLITSHLLKIQQ